jgi:hypothetical protein
VDNYYHDSHWVEHFDSDSIVLIRAGYRAVGQMFTQDDYVTEIPMRELPSLVKFLDEHGFIKPRLDERLRVEDLKITHRLLDLLEKRNG